VELHHRYRRNDPNAGLNTNPCTDTNAGTDTYTSSDTNTNPCTDTNAGTDSYTSSDTNTNPKDHANNCADTHAKGYTFTHPNANASGYWYYPGYGKRRRDGERGIGCRGVCGQGRTLGYD
jgi:hypothetical protein